MLRLIPICAFIFSMVASSAKSADIIPQAKIPFIKQAPEIDGVITPDEWGTTLHVAKFVSANPSYLGELQPLTGEFWIACDGKNIYWAVRSAVPEDGPKDKVRQEERKGLFVDSPDSIYLDESIELWIAGQLDVDTGMSYQIVVNSSGALNDKMFYGKKGMKHRWWHARTFRQAHTVKDGIWEAEFSASLRDFNIPNYPDKQIGVRVCRNYQNLTPEPDQSRWTPQFGDVGMFFEKSTMPKIRFTSNAPVIREIGFQNEDGIYFGIFYKNLSPNPIPIKVTLTYRPLIEGGERHERVRTINITPGLSGIIDLPVEFATKDNYIAAGKIVVEEDKPNGEIFYKRDFRWQVKPKITPWPNTEPHAKEEVPAQKEESESPKNSQAEPDKDGHKPDEKDKK